MNNTTATRRTLAELNAAPRHRTWSTYELESFWAVGEVGYMHRGTKCHLLSCERVVGYVGDWKPTSRQYKIGDTFSAHASCNENGQNIGRPIDGLDTSDITCEKCSPQSGGICLVKQAASTLSKALTRPPSHGGYREGSGRKPILDGGIKRTFVLTPAHLDLIDAWGRAHNIDNRSAALRHLIEASPMVPHPHETP